MAGVDDLIIATPPREDGSISPEVLVAARIGGVDRVLKAGGAQAIAALAFGTDSVPAVDKIFGAGNAWVTAAKRAVSGRVAIDLPRPVRMHRARRPHGRCENSWPWTSRSRSTGLTRSPWSSATTLAFSTPLTRRSRSWPPTSRPASAPSTPIGRHGAAVLVADLDAGLEVINEVAAEHVSLQCDGADALAARVRNAGAVFVGPWSPVAAGDYATGTNHILPTGTAARAWSGVGVESFGRWIELQRLTPAGAPGVSVTVSAIAAAEGLPAHAASVLARAERAGSGPSADDVIELFRRPDPVVPYPAPSPPTRSLPTARASRSARSCVPT